MTAPVDLSEVVDAVASRRATLTALTKSADKSISSAAGVSLALLSRAETNLRKLDEQETERQALRALYEQATDETTKRALKRAMHARSVTLLNELAARR